MINQSTFGKRYFHPYFDFSEEQGLNHSVWTKNPILCQENRCIAFGISLKNMNYMGHS